ncbi:uncharacterized protein LOC127744973 [Arachis duranensis]|uniref:Uncharacterized protein LOC127744973 n=1 Tax=Arachis duranensis TaxID=130453 RepID=A0A9C6TNY5_ARADU|nr:uncharacterized protein LOC127744973 [Arachis duranensis]
MLTARLNPSSHSSTLGYKSPIAARSEPQRCRSLLSGTTVSSSGHPRFFLIQKSVRLPRARRQSLPCWSSSAQPPSVALSHSRLGLVVVVEESNPFPHSPSAASSSTSPSAVRSSFAESRFCRRSSVAWSPSPSCFYPSAQTAQNEGIENQRNRKEAGIIN